MEANKVLEYKLCNQSEGESSDDCVCLLTVNNARPIFTLTDKFVNKHMLSNETVTIGDTDNKLYLKDENDNDVLTKVYTYTSRNRVENTVYYDNINKCLLLTTFVDDINSSLYKNKQLKNNIDVLGSSIYSKSNTRDRNTYIPTTLLTKEMPKANDLTGVDVEIVTLSIPNFMSYTILDKYRDDSGISEELQVVTFMAINTTDIGWDTNGPTLHDIITDGKSLRVKNYIGNNTVDRVYIQLV